MELKNDENVKFMYLDDIFAKYHSLFSEEAKIKYKSENDWSFFLDELRSYTYVESFNDGYLIQELMENE
tara:strand:- start:432 stop:638 length:207 start_codon:yes stop_codon:yes gene_type:complete